MSTANEGTTKTIVSWRILLFFALSFFLVCSLIRIRQPIGVVDLFFLVPAKNLYTTGVPQHYMYPDTPGAIVAARPHLHLRSIVLAFKLLGESDVVARLPGVVSVFLGIILVFLNTKSFSLGDERERLHWAALSSLLYASTPAVIQGSLIIDADSTVLIPAVLFLYWCFSKYHQEEKGGWAFLTGLAMAIALWGRVFTPAVFALILLGYVLISKKDSRVKLTSVGAIFSGTLLFVVTWYWYSRATGVPFSQPFDHIFSELTMAKHRSTELIRTEALRALITFSLWFGIFPLLLLLSILKRNFWALLRNSERFPGGLFLLSGMIIVGGFTFRGAKFGYIRQHSPAIPLIYIYIGIALSQLKVDFANYPSRKIVIVTLIVCIIQIFVVGDLLYTWRYTLRESAALSLMSHQELIKALVYKIILITIIYTILFVACFPLAFKTNIIGLLIVFSIGSNLGTAFLQGTANYSTSYNYGGRGSVEAARYIRERVPAESTVMAPKVIVYYLKLPNTNYLDMHDTLWTDDEALSARLLAPRTSGFVYSIVTNTVRQIKSISHSPSIQAVLRQHYDRGKVGSYTIWIRKGYTKE